MRSGLRELDFVHEEMQKKPSASAEIMQQNDLLQRRVKELEERDAKLTETVAGMRGALAVQLNEVQKMMGHRESLLRMGVYRR